MRKIYGISIIRAVLLISVLVPLVGLLLKRPADTEINGVPVDKNQIVKLSDSIEIVNTESDNVGKSSEQEVTLSISELGVVFPVIGSSPRAPSIDENSKAGSGPFAPSDALKIQESFKVDPPMRSIGQDWKLGEGTSTFIMPVSEGRDLEIQVERFESIDEEGGEFIGTVKGAPGSKVNLSYRGSAEAGRIDLPSEGRSYRILPGKDGAIIVQDRNPSLETQAGAMFPPVGVELPPVPDFIPPPPPSSIFDVIPPQFP